MAAPMMKIVVWNFPRFQLAGVCMRQSQRLVSSKKSETTAKTTAKSTAKGVKKETKQEFVSDTAKTPVSDASPSYTYKVPAYDNLHFYILESDMAKYRIPQPVPVKP